MKLPWLSIVNPEVQVAKETSLLSAYPGKVRVAYTKWLSRKTGHTYRLPTEAEWEYAASAGATTPYWWGRAGGTNNAHCYNCGSKFNTQHPAPVGSFKPNAFGVYDTAGNVMEWVQDCYHNSYSGAPTDGSAWENSGCAKRVARGGAYISPSSSLRHTRRDQFRSDQTYSNIGFRVVREP